MENLISEFSFGLFVWQSLIFIGLIVLLKKFAWGPILESVNQREQSIEEALKAAEAAKVEMARLKSDNQDLLKEARLERDAILKIAKETKENIVGEAKNMAKLEAEKIIASAKQTIETEKMAAVTELKNQVATLSIEIAEKIIKDKLSSEDKQRELIGNLVDDINLN